MAPNAEIRRKFGDEIQNRYRKREEKQREQPEKVR